MSNNHRDEIEHIAQCECGAITVTIAGENYSMTSEYFEERYGFTLANNIWCNCDSCVNHLSVEMCTCGSGKRYDECDEGNMTCGIPIQNIKTRRY